MNETVCRSTGEKAGKTEEEWRVQGDKVTGEREKEKERGGGRGGGEHNQRASKNQDALRSTYSAYREAFSYTGEFGVKARTLASAGALPPPLSRPLWPRLHPRYLFLRQPPQPPYLRSQERASARRLGGTGVEWCLNFLAHFLNRFIVSNYMGFFFFFN